MNQTVVRLKSSDGGQRQRMVQKNCDRPAQLRRERHSGSICQEGKIVIAVRKTVKENFADADDDR